MNLSVNIGQQSGHVRRAGARQMTGDVPDMTVDVKDETAVRTWLETELAALDHLAEGAAERTAVVEVDQTTIGRVTRIDAIQQQEMAKAVERRRAVQRLRFESALQRLDDGDFGYCVTCDEPVAEKRLSLDPSVPTCIACAEKAGV